MRLVAGRDAVAEVLARGNVAESYREDAAGQGTDAEVFLAGGAVAELLLAGAPWRSYWYGQPAEAAGRGAVAELLVRAAGESSWRERCGGMERSGSLCGKACRWASDDAAASWKSLPLGEDDAAAPGRCKAASGRCRAASGRCRASSGRC